MNKKKLWKIIFVVALLICICTSVAMVLTLFSGDLPDEVSTANTVASTSGEGDLPENPIDFSRYKEINEDIYAWIRIPNTNVDYPILRSYFEHDNYYLDRDIYKKYSKAGSIYTQKRNGVNFSDPNTLIYGHNMANKSMFATLLRFRDEEFFNNNELIYIYLPGRILTYKVFAAYMYDDRHILNSFDFSNEEVFSAYIESCLNPKTMVKNVREDMTLTVQDRIITLSTCPMRYWEKKRYLVQGVLISDERTKSGQAN